jgi:hypothetical protein
MIDSGQIGPHAAERWGRRREMISNYHGRIRIDERWCAGEQMEGRARQGVLIGAAIHSLTSQLLGRGVGDRSDSHVGRGETIRVAGSPGDTEIGQNDPSRAGARCGHENVGRLDVAMQQMALVGVVERVGNRRHDFERFVRGHAERVPVPHQPSGVRALDVIHRDPELAVVLSSIMDGDDMRMPEGSGEVGFASETSPVVRIGADVGREDFQGLPLGQPGMPDEVNLAHPPSAQ